MFKRRTSPSGLIVDSQKLQNLKQVYKFGERGSGRSVQGKVQDFFQLRDYHLRSGTLFEDPQFPADYRSLDFTRRRPSRSKYEDIVWKRPHELCPNPKLFVDSFSRFDVQQGNLANCWLLSAIANLTLHHNLFLRNVPNGQSFSKNYAGIFHFRFWQYGRWIDVVIDDRLPTINGELVFVRSAQKNEFWSALFEKAYVKLCGCYDALDLGNANEAMEDFTGGVSELYNIKNAPPNLFKILKNAYDRGSLIALSTSSNPDKFEDITPQGLVLGHAYSCTRVLYLTINKKGRPAKIALLRIRNPYGDDIEWNGPWSDKSREWRLIPNDEKRRLGLTFDGDGEFWMSFQDVLRNFGWIQICNLTPDSLEEGEVPKKWEVSMYDGSWVKGVTAGGCRNYIETFVKNPQYNISLSQPYEDGLCTVIVSLMQKNPRLMREFGKEYLTIGFTMFLIPDPGSAPKPLNTYYIRNKEFIVAQSNTIDSREVSLRLELPPGIFCIIPYTFQPNKSGEFLLRIFSETRNDLAEYDQPVGAIPWAKKLDSILLSIGSPIYQLFYKYSGGQEEIGWTGLQEILDSVTKHDSRRFSSDVCKTLVALLDENNSGKLGFDEFLKLWLELTHWTRAFQEFDKDNSHTINGFELREAINSAGFTVNARTLNMIMHRYGNEHSCLNFDDFIMCVIKLKNMIEKFSYKDLERRDEASFSMEEFIDLTMYS